MSTPYSAHCTTAQLRLRQDDCLKYAQNRRRYGLLHKKAALNFDVVVQRFAKHELRAFAERSVRLMALGLLCRSYSPSTGGPWRVVACQHGHGKLKAPSNAATPNFFGKSLTKKCVSWPRLRALNIQAGNCNSENRASGGQAKCAV